MRYIRSRGGQSIFEIVVAVAIAALIVGSATTAVIISLRSGQSGVASQKAYAIANESLNNVRSYAESSWSSLYVPPPAYNPSQGKDGVTAYHLAVVSTSSTSTILGIATGTEVISFSSTSTGENINYTSWFTISDVDRNSSNWIGSGYRDPTTLKITAYASWVIGGSTTTVDLATHVSKIRTQSVGFNNWSGSSGVSGPVTGPTSDYYATSGPITINSSGYITY